MAPSKEFLITFYCHSQNKLIESDSAVVLALQHSLNLVFEYLVSAKYEDFNIVNLSLQFSIVTAL